ncbi:hypothetical protein ACNKHT_23815 [Shigella flexneri]
MVLEFALSGESQWWRIHQQLTKDSANRTAEGLFKEERIITSAQQADTLWLWKPRH